VDSILRTFFQRFVSWIRFVRPKISKDLIRFNSEGFVYDSRILKFHTLHFTRSFFDVKLQFHFNLFRSSAGFNRCLTAERLLIQFQENPASTAVPEFRRDPDIRRDPDQVMTLAVPDQTDPALARQSIGGEQLFFFVI
jgi:hypothetical protein